MLCLWDLMYLLHTVFSGTADYDPGRISICVRRSITNCAEISKADALQKVVVLWWMATIVKNPCKRGVVCCEVEWPWDRWGWTGGWECVRRPVVAHARAVSGDNCPTTISWTVRSLSIVRVHETGSPIKVGVLFIFVPLTILIVE